MVDKKMVLVTVQDGVADVFFKDEDVEVVVVDYDVMDFPGIETKWYDGTSSVDSIKREIESARIKMKEVTEDVGEGTVDEKEQIEFNDKPLRAIEESLS